MSTLRHRLHRSDTLTDLSHYGTDRRYTFICFYVPRGVHPVHWIIALKGCGDTQRLLEWVACYTMRHDRSVRWHDIDSQLDWHLSFPFLSFTFVREARRVGVHAFLFLCSISSEQFQFQFIMGAHQLAAAFGLEGYPRSKALLTGRHSEIRKHPSKYYDGSE